MNFRLIAKYLGHFSIAIGLLMAPSALWAVWFGEWGALVALLEAMAASCGIGIGLFVIGRTASNTFYQREALALVGSAWLWVAAVGALPYLFGGIVGPVDAYFESMSGFTTTGSTIFVDIEAVPKSLLFWRSFTHWLGGMGIVLLFIAVLPYLGAGGKQLFRSESSGPSPAGLRPRIKDTAKVLYRIYLLLTAAGIVALMVAGMSFYDALCHTFGALATGGFSPRQASIGAFDSLGIELISMFLMISGGINFALYFAVLGGNWKAPFKDAEWRVYVSLLCIAVILVTLNLLFGTWANPEAYVDYSPGEALRYSAFQVVSIATTTGFATADFDAWPHFSRILLIMLMIVGGSAGSTSGGMKIVRVLMLAKMAYWRLEHTFRPKTVRAIRISGLVIDKSVQESTQNFFVLYVAWFVGGSLFMASLGLPLETAVSSIAATVNGVGPGLQIIGPVLDFHTIPAVGKLFLSLTMAVGRLELFTLLVLFVPAFWRHQ
jgi:trk system potassium uptake protein TrkH